MNTDPFAQPGPPRPAPVGEALLAAVACARALYLNNDVVGARAIASTLDPVDLASAMLYIAYEAIRDVSGVVGTNRMPRVLDRLQRELTERQARGEFGHLAEPVSDD